MKGKGKGAGAKGGWQQGGWQPKGWGKGMGGGKGMNGGKGGKGWKGKGKGKGKGVYGLDLMGNSAWGGDEYYDQNYDYAIRSIDSTYGRTLATLGPAPIALSDRYGSIAEEPETTAIPVPIANLVVQRRSKLRKMKTKIAKTQFAHPSNCGCCPTLVDESEITFYVHEEGMLVSLRLPRC